MFLIVSAFARSAAAQVVRPDTVSVVRDLVITHAAFENGIAWVGVFKNGSIGVQPGGITPGLFYSREGVFLQTGPHETEPVFLRGIFHDSAWGTDRFTSMLTVVGRNGAVARSFPLPNAIQLTSGETLDVPAGVMRPLAILPNNELVAYTVPKTVPTRWHRPEGSHLGVFRLSNEGSLLGIIGWDFPIEAADLSTVTQPFVAHPLLAASADGNFVVHIRAAVMGVDSGWIQVNAQRASGDTVYAKRYPYLARKISKGDADSAINAIIAASSRQGWADTVRSRVHPTIYPPILSAIVAANRAVWIRQPPDGSHIDYVVIDSTGTLDRVVQVPKGTGIRAVAGDTIWAVQRDASGTNSLVRLLMSNKK